MFAGSSFALFYPPNWTAAAAGWKSYKRRVCLRRITSSSRTEWCIKSYFLFLTFLQQTKNKKRQTKDFETQTPSSASSRDVQSEIFLFFGQLRVSPKVQVLESVHSYMYDSIIRRYYIYIGKYIYNGCSRASARACVNVASASVKSKKKIPRRSFIIRRLGCTKTKKEKYPRKPSKLKRTPPAQS